MAILAQLNEDAIISRIRTLPLELQEALDDQVFKSAVDDIGQDYGFDAEEISILEAEMTMCLLGFVHADELGGELKEIIDLDDPAELVEELKSLLAPFQPYLDKIYKFPAAPSVMPAISPFAASVPAGAASATGPTLNLKSNLPPPAPLPSVKTPEAKSVPASMPSAPGNPALKPNSPSAAPVPFVLQKETSAAQIGGADFKLNVPSPAANAAYPKTSAPVPPRPAQLEIGKDVKKDLSKGISMPAPAQRVVHYTDFKTSIGIQPAGIKPAPPANTPSAVPPAAASSPFSLGKAVSPASAAPGPAFIRNAPGVAPFIPPSAPSQTKTTAPAAKPPLQAPAAPAAPPKIVNFGPENKSGVQ